MRKRPRKERKVGKDGTGEVGKEVGGQKLFKGESGKEAAKRVLQEYGEYDPENTGPNTDFNQLKKYFDTHFE